MADTHKLLDSYTVGATSVSTIQFTSINQTYTDLKLLISVRNDDTSVGGNTLLGFNGSTAGYTEWFLQGAGSGTPGSTTVAQ
jgi:hypothetical protein